MRETPRPTARLPCARGASLATRSGGRTRAIAFVKTDDGWRLDDLPLSTALPD